MSLADGEKALQARMRRLQASIPTEYTVYKDGTTIRAETCTPGGTDYSDTDASTVIQAAWDAVTVGSVVVKQASTAYSLLTELDLTDNNKEFICERGADFSAGAAITNMVKIGGGWSRWVFHKLDGNSNAQRCIEDDGSQYCKVWAYDLRGYTKYGVLYDAPNSTQASIQNYWFIHNILNTVAATNLNVCIESPAAVDVTLFNQGNEYHFNFLNSTTATGDAYLMRVGTTGTAGGARDLVSFNHFFMNLEAGSVTGRCLLVANSRNYFNIGFVGGQTEADNIVFEASTVQNHLKTMSGAATTDNGTNMLLHGTDLNTHTIHADSTTLTLATDKELVYAESSELTISGGVITVVGVNNIVDTEGDAGTDDLDTINGGIDGMIIILRAANGARDVVVKDGVDNIDCAGDFTLDHESDTMQLLYDGTQSKWVELTRSSNA